MTATIEGTATPANALSERGDVTIDRVLWACDFSSGAMDALRVAVAVARAYGSDLTALHVIPSTIPAQRGEGGVANPDLAVPHLGHDASRGLDRCLRLARAASVRSHVALRGGNAVEEILGLAASLPASLIVMGRQTRSLIDPGVLGSVTEGILGRARCPVLVVPREATPAAGSPFRTILCATDFSPHAALALRYAASLAARNGARLTLLHVVEGNLLTSEREALRQARRRLDASTRDPRVIGCVPEVAVGIAPLEIVRLAAERAADLVVMGVQGARALHRFFFGSTAHRVVREVSCPVLAVRRG